MAQNARWIEPAAPSRRLHGERAALTEGRLLDAAAACFSEQGFRRTRLDAIARRAGVSRTLLYAYFRDKEDLLRRVRDRSLAEWRSAVEPALAAASSETQRLAALIEQTLRYARAHPLLLAILSEEGRGVTLGPDGVGRGAIDAWRARLLALLRAGIAAGEFDPALDAEALADVLRAMLLGVIDRMHRPAGPIDVSREEHVEAFVALVLRGVRR